MIITEKNKNEVILFNLNNDECVNKFKPFYTFVKEQDASSPLKRKNVIYIFNIKYFGTEYKLKELYHNLQNQPSGYTLWTNKCQILGAFLDQCDNFKHTINARGFEYFANIDVEESFKSYKEFIDSVYVVFINKIGAQREKLYELEPMLFQKNTSHLDTEEYEQYVENYLNKIIN